VATSEEAMERLRRLKDRPRRPFSVHLGRVEDVGRYVSDVPPAARRLMAKGWPGPVTLLLPVGRALPDRRLRRAGLAERLCPKGFVGLRCPDEPVAAAMLAAVPQPVVAPSANRAGQAPARSAEMVLDALGGQIDLLLDCGPTRHGRDSTIVKFSDGRWQIVREGVCGERAIRRLVRLTLLFVCTGNTCRSPMAAGLAKKLAAERLGCRVAELRRRGVEIASAGLSAAAGGRATPEAISEARRRGVNLARHRTRQATEELICGADLVCCMTTQHVESVRRMVPQGAGKVRRLAPEGDIADPLGRGPAAYARAAERIARAVKTILDESLP
jgi:protein-tyrosine phosphatase